MITPTGMVTIIPGDYLSMRELLDSGQLPRGPLVEPIEVTMRGIRYVVEPSVQMVFPRTEWEMSRWDNMNMRLLGNFFFDGPGYRPTPDVYTPSPENFPNIAAVSRGILRYPRHFFEAGPCFIVEVDSINYLVDRSIADQNATVTPVIYNRYSGLARDIPAGERTPFMILRARLLGALFTRRYTGHSVTYMVNGVPTTEL